MDKFSDSSSGAAVRRLVARVEVAPTAEADVSLLTVAEPAADARSLQPRQGSHQQTKNDTQDCQKKCVFML